MSSSRPDSLGSFRDPNSLATLAICELSPSSTPLLPSTMDGIRARLQGEVDAILGSFLDRAAAIDALEGVVRRGRPRGRRDQVRRRRERGAAAGAAPVNKEVQATIALVRNELAAWWARSASSSSSSASRRPRSRTAATLA